MAVRRALDVPGELLEAFEHGALATEYLAGVLPAAVWRAAPPGGKGRTIAGIVAHVQSVRRTFAKMGGAQPVPEGLDRLRSTQAQARGALRQSREVLVAQFREALEHDRARVKGMPRRTVNMMAYLMQHDAHHRGQITLLAHALGHRLSGADVMRIWGWKSF